MDFFFFFSALKPQEWELQRKQKISKNAEAFKEENTIKYQFIFVKATEFLGTSGSQVI